MVELLVFLNKHNGILTAIGNNKFTIDVRGLHVSCLIEELDTKTNKELWTGWFKPMVLALEREFK